MLSRHGAGAFFAVGRVVCMGNPATTRAFAIMKYAGSILTTTKKGK